MSEDETIPEEEATSTIDKINTSEEAKDDKDEFDKRVQAFKNANPNSRAMSHYEELVHPNME